MVKNETKTGLFPNFDLAISTILGTFANELKKQKIAEWRQAN